MQKYLVLTDGKNKRAGLVVLGSDLITPDMMILLIHGICATFTELYHTRMPMENAVVTLARFFDVYDPTDEDLGDEAVSIVEVLNNDEMAEYASLDGAYETMKYAQPVSQLGLPMYLSIRSYLNGNKGKVTEEDLTRAVVKIKAEWEEK